MPRESRAGFIATMRWHMAGCLSTQVWFAFCRPEVGGGGGVAAGFGEGFGEGFNEGCAMGSRVGSAVGLSDGCGEGVCVFCEGLEVG